MPPTVTVMLAAARVSRLRPGTVAAAADLVSLPSRTWRRRLNTAAPPSASSLPADAAADAATTPTPAPAPRPRRGPGIGGLVLGVGALAVSLSVAGFYFTDTRASFHRWLVPPLVRLVFPDGEDAHAAGVSLLGLLHRLGLHPRERGPSAGGPAVDLSVPVFGSTLDNPLAISAGLDKDGRIIDALFALGPAIVEIGGCTPLPQPGNPRPRLFRVPALEGLVNRFGLNSSGADDLAARLRLRLRRYAHAHHLTEADLVEGRAGVPPGSLLPGRLLAVQIAKNKETDEADANAIATDYRYCARRLGPYADILVVNVSSPNTPGLRNLQAAAPLTQLLSAVLDEASRIPRATRPRVMVKVSPDEDTDAQLEGVVLAVERSGVDGIIVGNTTKRRTDLVPDRLRLTPAEEAALSEQGGYSGPSTFPRTLDLVSRYRKLLDAVQPLGPGPASETAAAGQPFGNSSHQQPKVIFASGGISTGQQALQVLNAGASVAMVYTAIIYGGVGTITNIKRGIKEEILPRPS